MGNTHGKEAGTSSASIEAWYAAGATEERSKPENLEAEAGKKQSTTQKTEPNKLLAKIEQDKNDIRAVLEAMTSSNGLAAEMIRRKAALHNSAQQGKMSIEASVEIVKRAVVEAAKQVGTWTRQHPAAAVTILITCILLACTPAIIGAVGFTASGVAAGSIAAGIQASIGSVSAGSLFAILTSAGMGGFGVAIVAGGAVGIGATIVGAIVGWTRWKDANNGDGDVAAKDELRLKFKEDLSTQEDGHYD